jgi:hypothetical protein
MLEPSTSLTIDGKLHELTLNLDFIRSAVTYSDNVSPLVPI